MVVVVDVFGMNMLFLVRVFMNGVVCFLVCCMCLVMWGNYLMGFRLV